MLDEIKEIIGIACFAIMFSETSGIDWKIKPFSCFKCMAWWIGFFYFGFKIGFPVSDILAWASIFGYGAVCHLTSFFIFYAYKQIKGKYI